MEYDTLICGARLLDGTGSPAVLADVAIRDQRIVRISVGLDAELDAHLGTDTTSIIHAQGLYLAPGFIDVHTHDDINVIQSPAMLAKISQGVTTVIVGNCGISASPVTLKDNPPDPLNLLGKREDFVYSTFAAYAQAVIKANPAVNVGALIGHTALRSNVMDMLQRQASAEEIASMKIRLREALGQGALGMSSGLAYASALCATTEEVLALVEELADFNGVYTTHLRTEFDHILDAMDEAFATAGQASGQTGVKAKVPLIISHLKCAGAGNWGRSSEILQHIEQAARQQQVACDCYPYAASSSTLDLKQVTDENDIFITWSDPCPEQAGRLLKDIAQDWQLPLMDAAKKLQPGGAVYYCMDEQDVQNILRYPRSMIGSDGLPNDPHPHPRLWGTFPRVIGHYCRDLGIFELPQAIHKMTGLSAQEFGLHQRGVIGEGNFADLVLFDYDKIRDMATYENPKQMAVGVEKVWVNGHLSYVANKQVTERAGKFLFRR